MVKLDGAAGKSGPGRNRAVRHAACMLRTGVILWQKSPKKAPEKSLKNPQK
jgi:hypothetical protein